MTLLLNINDTYSELVYIMIWIHDNLYHDRGIEISVLVINFIKYKFL